MNQASKMYFPPGFPVKTAGAKSISQRKLVYGVGTNNSPYVVNPENDNGVRVYCPFYRVWQNMLMRCYDPKYKSKIKAYDSCVVHESWLEFMNFREWMVEQDWEGNQLDKDLMVRGCNLYSETTCVFISQAVNVFMTESRSNKGDCPVGVSLCPYDHSRYVAFISAGGSRNKSLGIYDDPSDAHLVWWNNKKCQAAALSEKQTNQKIASALVNYYSGSSPYVDNV